MPSAKIGQNSHAQTLTRHSHYTGPEKQGRATDRSKEDPWCQTAAPRVFLGRQLAKKNRLAPYLQPHKILIPIALCRDVGEALYLHLLRDGILPSEFIMRLTLLISLNVFLAAGDLTAQVRWPSWHEELRL